MYQTIQLSSCISVQGEISEVLSNGEVVIRDGGKVYRGRPIVRMAPRLSAAIVRLFRPSPRDLLEQG